jgi:hypothetical protein
VFFTGLIYGRQLAATVSKYALDLEVVCQVLDPEEVANRIEYLPGVGVNDIIKGRVISSSFLRPASVQTRFGLANGAGDS